MICIPSLTFCFDESRSYIAPAWSAPKGNLVYLSGRNGSGKSTYLKCLTQFLKQHIYSYIGHNPPNEPTCSLEFLSRSFSLLHSNKNTRSFSSPPISSSIKFGILSQGQQSLFLLHTMLDEHAHIWLIDEGWSHLDTDARKKVHSKIHKFISSGGIVIYTEHGSTPLFSPNLILSIEEQLLC